MEFKGTKGEWYKMDAKTMGVPFIIASGNETIFQAYGEDAEHNVNLTLCAREMLEMLIKFSNINSIAKEHINEDLFVQLEQLIKKATTI